MIDGRRRLGRCSDRPYTEPRFKFCRSKLLFYAVCVVYFLRVDCFGGARYTSVRFGNEKLGRFVVIQMHFGSTFSGIFAEGNVDWM